MKMLLNAALLTAVACLVLKQATAVGPCVCPTDVSNCATNACSGGTCWDCADGYSKSSTGTDGVSCNTGKRDCVKCDTKCTGTCLSNGKDKCDDYCESGYAVKKPEHGVITGITDYTCGACDLCCASSGCAVKGPTKCDMACNPGCSLVNYECVLCHPQCDTDGGGSCTTTCTCTGPCKAGYTVAGSICVACHEQCIGVCTAAGAGGCDDTCANGYVLDGNVCKACHPKCEVKANACSTPNTCLDKCVPGFLRVGTNCLPCSPNCDGCSLPTECCSTEGAGFCDASGYCSSGTYGPAENAPTKHACYTP